MAAEFYRRLRSGRLVGGLIRRGGARLQSLDPAPNCRERSPEMRLELLELLERVRLGFANDLVGLALRVAHGLGRMALSAAKDLVLGDRFLSPLVSARHDAGRLGMSLGDDALLFRNRPVRLLDLVWEVEADLVDQLHHLVLVDHHLRREWNVASVLDEVLEAVQQLVDLYLYFSFNAFAIGGGTRSATFPP